jgi:hypothetical protein
VDLPCALGPRSDRGALPCASQEHGGHRLARLSHTCSGRKLEDFGSIEWISDADRLALRLLGLCCVSGFCRTNRHRGGRIYLHDRRRLSLSVKGGFTGRGKRARTAILRACQG